MILILHYPLFIHHDPPAVGDGVPTRGLPCSHPSLLCWTQVDGRDNPGDPHC